MYYFKLIDWCTRTFVYRYIDKNHKTSKRNDHSLKQYFVIKYRSKINRYLKQIIYLPSF